MTMQQKASATMKFLSYSTEILDNMMVQTTFHEHSQKVSTC